ncbi:MAG TPA: TRAP transporter large permease subunit [Methylomirabilota bacterium]|nr:TRAP transporter large permease subunit [Methylomirabilota bacterium]
MTPPFGVALFVVAKIGNIPFHRLARAILPFLGTLLVVQVIVTYWPGLILFLPRLFFD